MEALEQWLMSAYQPAVAMVPTFTVAQGDRHFSINVNLTHDISTAQCHFGLCGGSKGEERGGVAIKSNGCDMVRFGVCGCACVWV